MQIRQLVENNVNIFDFDYPIFDEAYRPHFEQLIIDEFYFRDIGFSTVGKFKHYFRTRMNKIMPYYNKIYEATNLEQRILDNYEVVETYVKEGTENTTEQQNGTNNNVIKKSDTPSTQITLEGSNYLSELEEDAQTTGNTTEVQGQNNENWTRTMKGNIGVSTDADAVKNFITNLYNVDQLVINELKDLFLQVYY